MSALDTQVGGRHYKDFVVQPCILMNSLSGPAAHVLGYLVRVKGDDDLDKAAHWCDLAIENGMQDVQVSLSVDYDCPGEPNTYTAAVWCWRNGIAAASNKAQAILALETGDFVSAKIYIERMKEERVK